MASLESPFSSFTCVLYVRVNNSKMMDDAMGLISWWKVTCTEGDDRWIDDLFVIQVKLWSTS